MILSSKAMNLVCVFSLAVGFTLQCVPSHAQITALVQHSMGAPSPPPATATLAPDEAGRLTVNFPDTQVNQISFEVYTLALTVGQHLVSVSIPASAHPGGATSNDFGYESDDDAVCTQPASAAGANCIIVFGFKPPAALQSDSTAALTVGGAGGTVINLEVDLDGTGTAPPASATPPSGTQPPPCTPPNRNWFPTSGYTWPTLTNPTTPTSERLAQGLEKAFGNDVWSNTKEAAIDCYFSTDGQFAFFSQFKSIYNAASSAATVSANVGSFNFDDGMQISLGTNIQAAPAAASSGAPVIGWTPPTLSEVSAAQAAQNLFYGGNIYVYGLLPVYSIRLDSTKRWLVNFDLAAREGVDLQNFSGASSTASSPTTHFNALTEGYWQYDSDPAGAIAVPVAIFVGGQYGYAYTADAYARQYGFEHKPNTQVGDVSAGVLVSGVFNIAVQREFGPSQRYFNSAATTQPTIAPAVNNFKTWSFGIAYQAKTASTK